ncbi:hypothetical protein [Rhodoplanes sp. SY1]|uniref:hypothetical protein n=1 Tax=Rhodoplanes sp. SY1 TaxID=3166646 RepID=UPI0038B609FB
MTNLRRLVVGAGIAWALAFVVVGIGADLQLWGDGALFSYAVAVRDTFGFHWHNISGRLSIHLVAHRPAEALVALTGSARAGIVLYGLLLFAAPLLGLVATSAVDRTPGRRLFVAACLSTALLCPLVFPCPTEMWMAHALFWPTLALCHGAPLTRGGTLAIAAALLALVFSHEGGLVLAAAILVTLGLRGLRTTRFLRAAAALTLALAVWGLVKLTIRPDDYIGAVLTTAAFRFVDPDNLLDPAVLLIVAALAIFASLAAVLRRAGIAAPVACAFGTTVLLLAVYWLALDHAVLAENRYPLRTVLLIGPPVLAVLAVMPALRDEDRLPAWLRRPADELVALARRIGPAIAAGAFLLVMLIHAVETTKFGLAWRDYADAVRRLATGAASDPKLGDPRFVSAARIAPALQRLAWNSTTPYLSVLVAPGFAPTRLVVDPTATYFWISCATATRSAAEPSAVPAEARALLRRLACLHRP